MRESFRRSPDGKGRGCWLPGGLCEKQEDNRGGKKGSTLKGDVPPHKTGKNHSERGKESKIRLSSPWGTL